MIGYSQSISKSQITGASASRCRVGLGRLNELRLGKIIILQRGQREQRENNMISKDYSIAKELKERLSNVTSVVDLIIFGSRARGDQDEYSDMDVFIEVATLDKDLKERIYEIVWEVGFENFMVISPLICTKDEIENSPLRSAPIVKNIFEEGIRI